MAENGLTHADAMSWLMPAAQHAGLPDREIEPMVNSAFRIAPDSAYGAARALLKQVNGSACEHACGASTRQGTHRRFFSLQHDEVEG